MSWISDAQGDSRTVVDIKLRIVRVAHLVPVDGPEVLLRLVGRGSTETLVVLDAPPRRGRHVVLPRLVLRRLRWNNGGKGRKKAVEDSPQIADGNAEIHQSC